MKPKKMMYSTAADVVEIVTEVVDVVDAAVDVVDVVDLVDVVDASTQYSMSSHRACQNVLSVKTHRRAATGNTRSREASGTAGGPRSLGQRPKSPAHALAW
jgi:hypothetical protein